MGVAIKSPVIVLALYDIGRDNWDSFNLSYNTYLWWMKNTLSLDANIVVFTEDKFSSTIEDHRKEFDPELQKTIIVNRPLEDLECYRLYNSKLSDLMSSEQFKAKIHEKVPEMNRPLYNVIMFNKLFFLKEVNDRRYFDNDLLIWADAGGLREHISNYANQAWPSLRKINQIDNSKITFFSHKSNVFVEDPEYHSFSQVRIIQGTSFFVPSTLVDDLTEQFNKTVEESVEKGYIGSDEKVLDITFTKEENKNKFNVIKCDWRTYFKIFKEDGNDLRVSSKTSKNVFIDLGSFECSSASSKSEELNMDDSWEIHIFEPNDLVDTKSSSKSITACPVMVYREAVWKRDGKVILNRYGEDGRSQGTLLEETGEGRGYSDYYDNVIVRSIDLYKFLNEFSDKQVYIFMDVEFSEYEVLESLLSRGWPSNIKKLWVEWHGVESTTNVDRALRITRQITNRGTSVEILNRGVSAFEAHKLRN